MMCPIFDSIQRLSIEIVDYAAGLSAMSVKYPGVSDSGPPSMRA